VAPPRSLNTVDLRLSSVNSATKIPVRGQTFSVAEVFPNPFSQTAQVRFFSEKNADYSLEVFDLEGKQLYKRELGFFPAGSHQFEMKRNGLESGLYIFRLTNSEGQSVQYPSFINIGFVSAASGCSHVGQSAVVAAIPKQRVLVNSKVFQFLPQFSHGTIHPRNFAVKICQSRVHICV
jgi:hypothetical protein